MYPILKTENLEVAFPTVYSDFTLMLILSTKFPQTVDFKPL